MPETPILRRFPWDTDTGANRIKLTMSGLENRYTRKGIGGSNPSLSAPLQRFSLLTVVQ